MMKKNLFWMVAAALTFVGCSEDELLESGGDALNQNAVTFGTYVSGDVQSRATVVDNTTLKTEGFGVNAWYTKNVAFNEATEKEAFMTKTKVTYNEDKLSWTYSPLKYWPNNKDHKVSFFAYGPYSVSNKVDDTGTNINFTVEADVKDQVDLIYNTNYTTIDMKKPAVNTRINFTFGHALARIAFSVEAAVDVVESNKDQSANIDANTVINVKRVALVGADAQDGTYELDESSYTGPFYTEGTLTLLNPGEGVSPWSSQTGTQGFVLNGENFYRTIELTDGSEVVQLHKFNQKQPLTNEESYLMVIPQDLRTSANSGSSAGFKIYIEYDVITTGEDGNDSSTIENKIVSKDAMSVNFEQGKAYNFNLVLGMTSVQFDASVTDWVTDENPEINQDEWLPENKDDEEDDVKSYTLVATKYLTHDGTNILIEDADDLGEARDLINAGSQYKFGEGEDNKVYKVDYANEDIATIDDDYTIEGGDPIVMPDGDDGGEGDSEAEPTFPYFYEACYLQINDVALSGEWTPIGTTEVPFTGNYEVQTDADYKLTISGLQITTTTSHAGLFGYVAIGKISGIRMENVAIGTVDSPVTVDYAAAIAAKCGSPDFYDCSVVSGAIYGEQVAGIAAIADNSFFTNCSNAATIKGSESAAGIYAGPGGLINSCKNEGNITSTDSYAAGIAVQTSQINGAANSGVISGYSGAGGIVAGIYDNGGFIIGASNTNDVTSTNGDAGGIVGYMYGNSIKGCYSTASTIKGKYRAGGVVGYWSVDTPDDDTDAEAIKAAMTACYSTTTTLTATDTEDGCCGALCAKIEVGINKGHSHTFTACYYSGYTGDGVGNNKEALGVTPVDGSTTTWATAITEMNTALTDTGWLYKENTGDDATTTPARFE